MQCTIMETRRCPASYGDDGCGDRLCARFESDDETPWVSDDEQVRAWNRGDPAAIERAKRYAR